MAYNKINPKIIKSIVKIALAEDLGKGDITTKLFIPRNKKMKAKIIAKENFLLCGTNIAKIVFKNVDPGLKFKQHIKEGAWVKKNKVIAVISGKASSILSAERVALNFLSLLSGIATKAKKFVEIAAPYKTKIFDTRKTIPGLRILQKYAVRVAGGYNHRFSLDEMILVKDNHLKTNRGCIRLPKQAKKYKIEIEAQNLNEFKHAQSLKPEMIMLDNMRIKDIKKAVKLNEAPHKLKSGLSVEAKYLSGGSQPRKYSSSLLEVSGGINLGNIKKYAACGVDIISIGALTDSVESVDISLDIA